MFELTSSDFVKNGDLPKKHTCQGANIAPILEILNPPEKTVSFVLIMDDPDAPKGNWLHWMLWNIPSTTKIINDQNLTHETVSGINDFKEFGYGGPCPHLKKHQYRFFLHAIDKKIHIDKNASRLELEMAIQGHIIASCELNAYYEPS